MAIRVVAVDVGSVSSSRFAWAAFDAPGLVPVREGTDPPSLVEAVVTGLRDAGQVALLMEAPMAVPVPDTEKWRSLGQGRRCEGNRPWSATAGACALATGLVQTAWILREVAARTENLTATVDADAWLDGRARLLLAEAFVSGEGKPVSVPEDQNAADAAAAGRYFVDRLARRAVVSDVSCAPHASVNLLAATAMWAGLNIADDELHRDVVVSKVRPVPEA